MLTLRAAGQALAAARSIDTMFTLAATIGFGNDLSRLDDDARHSLGLDLLVDDAAIVAGSGSLRALLLVVSGDAPLREWLQRLAARLDARAPHVLWLIIATQRATTDLGIAAWTGDCRPPRVAALLVDRARVVDSDAETVRALSAVPQASDLLCHTRWVEILGRDALTVRFYRALERALHTLAASSHQGTLAARRELALLQASRLLFLSFLEAKGWLDRDLAFLAHRFDACMTSGGRFHERVLRPLWFGTLNTPIARRAPAARAFGQIPFLNGGLFARTAVERANRRTVFSDEAYGHLIASVFSQFRFTAREETATWSEAAVDPEMLGRAFESLMAAAERRRTGAFYTPRSLVERVTEAGLAAALGKEPTREAVERISILDPACGSGAFLVHALERLADLLVDLGDTRDVGTIRRDVLARSIYGVDVNPTAVWLCELRLWLSVAIESSETDPAAVVPLPNLDRSIRVGDALSGNAFTPGDADPRDGTTLHALRRRYAAASGARKETLARRLDRAERARTVAVITRELDSAARRRRDLVVARRGRDLFGAPYQPSVSERAEADDLRRRAAALRALRRRVESGGALSFAFAVHFGDVAARGGFDLVLGNPPWIRLHRIPIAQRAEYRRRYSAARGAAWEPGAAAAGAGRGFAAQIDVAALFAERSVALLAPRGCLSLLLPVKLWRSLAGGGLRRLLHDHTDLLGVEDFSEAPGAFDAAVYPSLLVARRRHPPGTAESGRAEPGGPRASSAIAPAARSPVYPHTDSEIADRENSPVIRVAVHHRSNVSVGWRLAPRALPFDQSAGAPWLLLPRDARRAFDRVRAAGVPLAESDLGRPRLGVKCGCNEAFCVELDSTHGELARVRTADGQFVLLERSLLRPLLRGERLRRWRAPAAREHLLWTHDASGAALARLPQHAASWLGRWRRELARRSDARHRGRWWSLFRIDSARAERPRVVWNDVGREPRACVLDAGDPTVALNSCYVVRCRHEIDARAFAILLNGPVARAWLNALAEPARGGYRRYLGWTLALLPIPADWPRARERLAQLWPLCESDTPPTDGLLLEASLAAYQLSYDDVAPLVAWANA